mmetsp:Transcript_6601/g.13632  ORF Transcript_6601/g.13632 Transcript_6601/m.13632 type:complete len:348 (-) Transcript_6601:258-1301(-)
MLHILVGHFRLGLLLCCVRHRHPGQGRMVCQRRHAGRRGRLPLRLVLGEASAAAALPQPAAVRRAVLHRGAVGQVQCPVWRWHHHSQRHLLLTEGRCGALHIHMCPRRTRGARAQQAVQQPALPLLRRRAVESVQCHRVRSRPADAHGTVCARRRVRRRGGVLGCRAHQATRVTRMYHRCGVPSLVLRQQRVQHPWLLRRGGAGVPLLRRLRRRVLPAVLRLRRGRSTGFQRRLLCRHTRARRVLPQRSHRRQRRLLQRRVSRVRQLRAVCRGCVERAACVPGRTRRVLPSCTVDGRRLLRRRGGHVWRVRRCERLCLGRGGGLHHAAHADAALGERHHRAHRAAGH